jgi:hypothetical protein
VAAADRSDAARVVETAVRRPAAERWRTVAARLSSAAAIGFLTGAIVGGVGGRIAMLVLRLTSDPSVRGLQSDDGFTIGVVSSETGFLVTATAFLGVIGALVYLVIRPWVPPRLRPWTSGIVAGVVGGAVVIGPEGIDFRLLSPIWLAVAMFIALPAAYGFVLAVLIERSFLRPAGRRWHSFIGLVLLIPLLPLPVTFGIRTTTALGVVVAVVVVIWFLGRGAGAVSTWTSPGVTWLGRTAVAVLIALAGAALIRDVVAVL